MKTKLAFVTVILVAAFLQAACATAAAPITPAAGIDLPRYMGRWYVVASIPTPFERDGYNMTETYRLNPDGTVCTSVRLRPDELSSPVRRYRATARVAPGRGNGEWQVDLPYFYNPEYRIGWVKPDYSQVLVVRSKRDYLWFMSRTPQVSVADYENMLRRARAMGYRTSRIQPVPQEWPEIGGDREAFTAGCT